MFRHERPQKGRYRQFYQIGVEAFGMADADLDAELILISRRLWQRLGLLPHVSLEINTLGTLESRKIFREKLVNYFQVHYDQLDEDSRRRLETNPLRILDSKNPQVKAVVANAPTLLEYVDEASLAHYQNLKRLIDDAGVAYVENPYLVGGLDYYSRTVFEWTTTKLGAQATVCAGGRYDGLVEMLGGTATPACGFAMGVERLVGLMQEIGLMAEPILPQVFIVSAGEQAQTIGLQFAESLRDAKDGIRIVTNCGGGSFKAQMKRADKSGAKWAVLIGDDEVAKGAVTLKPLREEGAQETMPASQALEFLVKQV
jgi:histidyl-tRNA synthetase